MRLLLKEIKWEYRIRDLELTRPSIIPYVWAGFAGLSMSGRLTGGWMYVVK